MLPCSVKIALTFERLPHPNNFVEKAHLYPTHSSRLAHSQNWKAATPTFQSTCALFTKHTGVHPHRPNLELAPQLTRFGVPAHSVILVFQQIFHGAAWPDRR